MNYRFSGHETFPCRYAWLPKAYRALSLDPSIFQDEDEAMTRLGVGKNMVRAIRFWIQATGLARPTKSGELHATALGEAILSPSGLDPFLEDIRTLWMLHWVTSTQIDEPLFAWEYMLNRWHHPEVVRSGVIKTFRSEAKRLGRELSDVTLEQHFDVFLHTYHPTRGRKADVQEDTLDCPFVELALIERVGERADAATGKREDIFAFRRTEKPEISSGLFIYCLNDYWTKRRSHEQTLTFRDIAVSEGSPGQIFKLPESDLRERLEKVEQDSAGVLKYRESTSLRQLIRKDATPKDLLAAVYQ